MSKSKLINERNQRIYNLLLNKQRYELCSELFKSIIEVPYAVIKGETLSLYCYKNLGCRTSHDIDLLIPPSYVNSVEISLENCGFIRREVGNNLNERRLNRIFCTKYFHQTMPYKKITKYSSAEIDVNFNVLWGENKENEFDMNDFLSDTINIYIYDQNIRILTPVKALLQLCLHHYKELNSIYLISVKKSINMDMFKEIYYLIRNNESIEPQLLYDLSYRFNVIPYIYYMLYFTNIIYNDERVKMFVDIMYTEEGERLLNKYGLSQSEQKEWRYSFRERIQSDNLYDLIKQDLNKSDLFRIKLNSKLFGGLI